MPILSGDPCVAAGHGVAAQRLRGTDYLGVTVAAEPRAGHRRIAARLQVPAATVRGWLRRAGRRLEAIRAWFLTVAVRTGVDVTIPDGVGCGWADVAAAVTVAAAAIRQRFGPAGLLGAVTLAQVLVAVSGGRLLSPDWSVA